MVTWILTADALTYLDAGVFDIRQTWYHFPDIGVAAMPMAVLRDYAARKGWAWSTQEITDGLAADARDIAALGDARHSTLVIGHPTEQPNRPLGVAVAHIDMRDRVPTVLGSLDRGHIGAPAFVAFPDPTSPDPNSFSLKCIGVVLPGDTIHPIATFDKIRPRLRQIVTDDLQPGAGQPP